MRKTILFLLAAVAAITLCFSLAACSTTPSGNTPSTKTKSYYKVTFFDCFVGGREITQRVDTGKTATKPSDPSRSGYTFDGWFDDYEVGSPFDLNKAITADTNVYAHWTKNVNVVTFKYNDGRDDTVVTIDVGSKVSKPADPTSDDYIFTGWFKDAACTVSFDFGAAVSEDQTIYAGWRRSSVRLTFNLNYSGAPAATNVNVALDQAITVPASVVTEREMYAFEGWYLKAFPTETDAAVDLSKGISDDTVLYAKWRRTHYSVTFDPNERTMQKQISLVEVGAAATVPAFEREGYSLDSVWYAEAGLKTPVSLASINDDIVVYAKWNILSFNVSFDLNYEGATGTPATQTIEYGKYSTRPATPEREGYIFLGWFTDKTEGAQYNFEQEAIAKDIKVYAHWMEAPVVITDVTVTFDYNYEGLGGKYVDVTIGQGEAVGAERMPADPTFDIDAMFMGWYTDAACTTPFDPSAILLDDTTVYARILKGYVFEAEYVDLTDAYGTGSSVELYEEAMIFSYEKIGQGTNQGKEWVSNGWYVSGLYYKGASIEFAITAAEEVKDAILILRVSTEFKPLFYNPLTSELFRVDINPIYDEYGDLTDEGFFDYELPLTLPLPNTEKENDPDGEKTPFEDVIISYHFHLDKGVNYVTLTTNNVCEYASGTFRANAPMIDYMKVYANQSADLTMDEHHEFIERKLNDPNS